MNALSTLLKAANRGFLLDLVIFAANLLLMSALAGPFIALVRGAAGTDGASGVALFGFGLLLFVLPPVGAILKRWHFHRGRPALSGSELPGGCLFNPIFYFCLVAVIFAGLNAAVIQYVYGRKEPPGAVFMGTIFGGIALILVHTILVYRFFSPPKSPPRSAFLRGKASEILGDACIFANALMFQLIWNSMSCADLGPPGSVGEFVGRALVLAFLALLLYFPPRMFYLAQDAGKARTWVMILIANSPLIVRFVLGGGPGGRW